MSNISLGSKAGSGLSPKHFTTSHNSGLVVKVRSGSHGHRADFLFVPPDGIVGYRQLGRSCMTV